MTPLTAIYHRRGAPLQQRTRPRPALYRGNLRVYSQRGFGEKETKFKRPGKQTPLPLKQLKQDGVLDPQQGWLPVAKTSDLQGNRATCPVITTTGVPVVLYKAAGEIYCSDANSTAYRYPMNDARVFEGPKGPAVECPFDGTTYDLETGEVLEWCPKNNPVRMLLGTLKSKESPKSLSVYDVVIGDDGTVFVKLF